MTVELSAEAQAQVDRIDAWWRENRQAAPDLFAEELTAAFLYVAEEAARVYVVAVWSAFRGRGPRL